MLIYIYFCEFLFGMIVFYCDYVFVGLIWGFVVEMGLYVLCLILVGVFDDFFKLCIVFGYLGEGLLFFIDWVDICYGWDCLFLRCKFKLCLSDYLKCNFVLMMSGMNYGLLFC